MYGATAGISAYRLLYTFIMDVVSVSDVQVIGAIKRDRPPSPRRRRASARGAWVCAGAAHSLPRELFLSPNDSF